MCEGLFFAFRDYCKYNNHKFKAVPIYSSSTMSLGTTDTLNKIINSFKPTYIILALGSNELFIKDIKKNRDKYVKSIIQKIGKRKYIWIGPPNWKKDTGINDMIASNVPRNQFFLSRDLKFQRISDGAHPTRASSRDWADTIATWVMKKSCYPILLNKPPADFQKKVEKPKTLSKTTVKHKHKTK
ncbi:MAG: SGNH/GDSL hydrolase family protein, partial [Bacteroidetes bacterium]|nr:SGNH/GDSL hydrolase family protein [Bacteroidota bacterium]